MEQSWLHRLDVWRDFYTFTGTAAATLMGLMFVVVSLVQRVLTTEEGRAAVGAFFTPIVAFFATEIVVTMLLLIPAITATWLALSLAGVGIVGVAYMVASGVHARWRKGDLDLDDWIWYFVLPAASYVIIIVSAVAVWNASAYGMYGIAVVMGVLLLIGVRNAWDLVVYTLQRASDPD